MAQANAIVDGILVGIYLRAYDRALEAVEVVSREYPVCSLDVVFRGEPLGLVVVGRTPFGGEAPKCGLTTGSSRSRMVENLRAWVLREKTRLMPAHAAREDEAPDGVKTVRAYLARHPEAETFSERDLTRAYDRFQKDRASLEDSLRWLANRNVIREVTPEDRPQGKRGRKPSRVWEYIPAANRCEAP